MTLDEYIRKKAISPGKLSQALEIHPTTLWAVRTGRSKAGPKLIEKIVQFTGGLVTHEELVLKEPS